jgi:hypothetical protein
MRLLVPCIRKESSLMFLKVRQINTLDSLKVSGPKLIPVVELKHLNDPYFFVNLFLSNAEKI